MHFGLRIDGNGTQFAISDLGFSMASSDPGNVLGYSYVTGSYGYSSSFEGVLKGADGVLWTADDVFVTSGSADQLVDGLVGRGSGNSLDAYCDSCTTAQQQAAIDSAASYWDAYGSATFTGTYTLGDFSGSGTFNIAAVPEPGTWAMMLLGFAGIGVSLRRRKAAATIPTV